MIEFCLAGTFIFLPILAGLATVGMSMVAATQAGSLNQTAGQMFSSGTDFTQPANQNMLLKIAGNLVTNTSGSGVVIVSEIDYTNNAYVCSNQISIPLNGGTGASLFATGPQVSSTFTALMPNMTNGQVAYTAETYYNNPQFTWLLAPAGTSSGIYVKGDILMRTRLKSNRSGAMLVLAALFCLALIPMLGLAIDGSNVYLMRNQITMALDAAVLAANRSLNLGNTIDTQRTNATVVAQTTFAANISGMNPNLGTPAASFNVSQDPITKIVSVTGSVGADLPLMMMGMIGFTSTHVDITATSQRRAVNIILVLDHSGPIAGTPLSTDAGRRCDLREDVCQWNR